MLETHYENEPSKSNIYENTEDNPTPIKETGLSGFWAKYPSHLTSGKWKSTLGPKEYEDKINKIQSSSEIVGLSRSIQLISFLNKVGFNLRQTTVADIGAGNGNLTLPLAQCGANVIAADPSSGQISELNSYVNNTKIVQSVNEALGKINQNLIAPTTGKIIDIKEAPAENLPIADETLDAIFFKFCLNWTDDRKALSEAKRTLKADGAVFIMTTTHVAEAPNLFCKGFNRMVRKLKEHGAQFKHFDNPKNPNPLHHLPTLKKYMEKIGFEFENEQIYLEETAQSPEDYLDFLLPITRNHLMYYVEGNHGMSEHQIREAIIAAMYERAEEDKVSLSTIEPQVLIKFNKI